MASVFSIFPASIWEMIFEFMDGQSIQMTILAIPELDIEFNSKKSKWLFGLILPHLYKIGDYFPYKHELLQSCAVVCKRWGECIEDFQVNHPSRRPYNFNEKTRRSLDYLSFSYEPLSLDVAGCFTFTNVSEIQAFQNALANNEIRDNPFMSKPVNIVNVNGNVEDSLQLLTATSTLLESCGQHLLTLSIQLPIVYPESDQQGADIVASILHCIQLVPNIRHVHIGVCFDLPVTTPQTPAKLMTTDKRLYCETLHLDVGMEEAMKNYFLDKFGIVSKLITSDTTYHADKECLLSLVELDVIGMQLDIFPIANYSALRKLKLTSTGGSSITVSTLFRLMGTTPIEELELQSYPVIGQVLRPVMEFQSLKYLRLCDHRSQNLDFLYAFTRLEQLDIEWHYPDSRMVITGGEAACTQEILPQAPYSLTNIVRFYLYKRIVPENACIWAELPPLKILTVMSVGGMSMQTRFAKGCGNKPFVNKLY